jgi:hypothetical protein
MRANKKEQEHSIGRKVTRRITTAKRRRYIGYQILTFRSILTSITRSTEERMELGLSIDWDSNSNTHTSNKHKLNNNFIYF